MRVRRTWLIAFTLTALVACDPGSPAPMAPDPSLNLAGVAATVTGGGKFDVNITGGSIGTFGFSAVGRDYSGASGQLHFQLEFQGQHVEFQGVVTCVSVDRTEGRAWIGGVVTQNRSEHPSYTTERTQPGRDIWFRILDNGTGGDSAPDRTTFVGFEGDRGIITSEEYCQVQPWVDGNAGTWAVIEGDVTLR